MALHPGDRIDRYRLVRLLGAGGQGAVWLADDPLAPGARVALKLFFVDAVSDEALERARREARTLARLSHPTLVRCEAVFEDLRRGILGLVLDFVEGKPLDALLGDARLTFDLRVHVLRHVADGLAYLHRAGLVHRDIKPENVLVDERFFSDPTSAGAVKIVDFGIAIPSGNPKPLTNLGNVIGTPAYMPPELVEGSRDVAAAPTADVFAFGALASVLLYGAHPTGLAHGAKLVDYAVVYRDARRRGEEILPRSSEPWRDLIARCCAMLPERRLRDGDAILAAMPVAPTRTEFARGTISLPAVCPPTIPQAPLQAASAGRPPGRRKATAIAVAMGPLVVLAAAIWIALSAGGPVRQVHSAGPPASGPRSSTPLPPLPTVPRAPPVDPTPSASRIKCDWECPSQPVPCGAVAALLQQPCEPLDPTTTWRFRPVSVLDKDKHAMRHITVCATNTRTRQTRCGHLGDTSECSTWPSELEVRVSDLLSGKIDVEIRDVYGTTLDRGTLDPNARAFTKRALCRGIRATVPGASTIGAFDFFLDPL